MIVAQLSDFHARPPGVRSYGGLDTNAMMRAAIAAVAKLDPAPDCVIVSGDLADCGLAEEYAQIDAALDALPMPVFAIPGNHDRREAMRAGLAARCGGDWRDPDFLHMCVDRGPLRLIGLDSVTPGATDGEICPRRQAWLADRLAEGGGRPTLVFIHHPPFPTGVPAMDPMMCRTGPGFARLLAGHPEILIVAAGHYHRPIVTRYAGTLGFVAPGVAHQVAFDLRPAQPTRLVHEPPGFAVHAFTAQAGLVSHVVPIGDYGPIMEFDLPEDYPGR